MSISSRIKGAWNAFISEEQKHFQKPFEDLGASYSVRPDRVRLQVYNDRTIIPSIYTRIGVDVASISIRHIRKDENGSYLETINSGLNECLNIEANIDQGGTAFRQDIAMTLFDKGVVAVVPVDTTLDPRRSGSYDIRTLRVGEITQWYPRHVKVELYNDRKGVREEILIAKSNVAIIENPLYSVMNEPNSTLQRLIRKLNLLDSVDEQAGSGKLDLIIQLPYVIKSETRKAQAEKRRKDIEVQLTDSKYGIAYTDGTERITQLNRPAENNLMAQVEYLTGLLYTQLGMTKEVFDGTADEQTMLNYHNRTIEPVMSAISEALTRAFLTKTARSQNQSIEFFRDPFRLVAVSAIAEIADKFTRNEIMSSNEVRGVIGFRPSKDPKADELRNSNIAKAKEEPEPVNPIIEEESQNGT